MPGLSIMLPIISSFLDWPGDPASHCIVVYISGCEHGCKGCCNPSLQNSTVGAYVTYENFEYKIMEALRRHKTNKLVFSGGDPLFPSNLFIVKQFLLNHQEVETTIFTGYSIAHAQQHDITGYSFIKCGKYDNSLKQKSEKTNTRFVLASENQKLYNRYNQCVSKAGVYYFGGTSWIIKLKHWLQLLQKKT